MDSTYEIRIINHALKTCGYYPLRAIQRWLVDTHFNKANSTMMNIGALIKFPKEIDLNRLAQAVTDTLKNFDIFRCRLVFHPDTDDFCQRFDGEIEPVTVEKISDEEFEKRKENLRMPYPLINKPLYRMYIFETPTAKYFYLDFYHAIMDGTAVSILFWREIGMRYKGKKITHIPQKYADYILEELRVSPEELAEGNKFWHEMLKGFDSKKHLPPPDVETSQAWKSENFIVPLQNINHKYFSDSSRKENIFFLAVSMFALAKSSGSKNSIMSWIHNGRNTTMELRLMGLMIEQYPISWNFEQDITVGEFLEKLAEKTKAGLKYRRSLKTVYEEGIEDDCATFIFQKNTENLDNMNIGDHVGKIIELPQNEISAAENSLDIDVNLTNSGKYLLVLKYDASRYSETAMEKFAVCFDEIVLQLKNENKFISEILA
ncbi:MAG: hypothetical protein IK062_05965 [Selenomonadaceae bacterium]|nr:hypothetical protein [Selenomonadaceae bacterium]